MIWNGILLLHDDENAEKPEIPIFVDSECEQVCFDGPSSPVPQSNRFLGHS